MMSAITIRSVEGLQPGGAIWDDAVRGFGVRRQRQGASYVLKYRVYGQQRMVTIGRHGSPWTPDTARREAKRLLGQVAGGGDPARAKAADHKTSLAAVIEDYLAYAARTVRPSTLRETERYLRVRWGPLHAIPIGKVTRRDVARTLTEMGYIPSASRARIALSTLFNWAIRQDYDIAANPVTGTDQGVGSKSRERVLSNDELAVVWKACRDDDFGRIVRLLILTGQRCDEIGGLRWSEVQADRIVLPGERTKNHRAHEVPLTPLAMSLLPAIRREGCVFGRSPMRGFSGWSCAKASLVKRATIAPFWLHDIRRSFATGCAEIGVLPHIIEAVLNHVSGHKACVAGIYNKARYATEVRDALSRWSMHVAALVG